MSKQALPAVEIENAQNFTIAFADKIWIHDASVRWDVTEQQTLTFGVSNLTNEEPFIASVATPVSAVGRSFFVRLVSRY